MTFVFAVSANPHETSKQDRIVLHLFNFRCRLRHDDVSAPLRRQTPAVEVRVVEKIHAMIALSAGSAVQHFLASEDGAASE